jgi:hypothetical protein
MGLGRLMRLTEIAGSLHVRLANCDPSSESATFNGAYLKGVINGYHLSELRLRVRPAAYRVGRSENFQMVRKSSNPVGSTLGLRVR